MEQIINSLLDTDLYKITMQNAVLKKFPKSYVKYSFILRNPVDFPDGFALELRNQLKMMESIKMTKDEKKWLSMNCYYLDPSYIDFLSGYEYDSSEVGIVQDGGDLTINIEGWWYRTILWEVPLMALISELYFKMSGLNPSINVIENTSEKAKMFKMNNIFFADFGTRRRYSKDIQDKVINTFKNYSISSTFVGTSNVYFAYKYNIKPIGTHAHEWFMFHAAKYGYKMANKLALDNWVDVYQGDLGIALSDTFTTDSFLDSFDKKFAKLYDGVRHDSGDPIHFAKKVINHYKKLGIDPTSKTIIFSDSLNVKKAEEIAMDPIIKGNINVSFGIGTNFTNDVGVKPLNMVIKMTSARFNNKEWVSTIKLSDDKGKHTGNEKEIEVSKYVLNIK